MLTNQSILICSSEELLESLTSNIVYFDDSGLVVLNKPHGLGLEKKHEERFSLKGALKGLADHLNVQNLEVIKTVPRYYSGCVLLSSRRLSKKVN